MGLYMLVFLGGAPLGSPAGRLKWPSSSALCGPIGGGVISAAGAVGVAPPLARARGARLRCVLRLAVLAPPRPSQAD